MTLAPQAGTVLKIDGYICSLLRAKPGKVARQKLAYGVQRWAISMTGEPAFDSRCECWPLGPVFPELFFDDNHKETGQDLSPVLQGYCKIVVEKLGDMSGGNLATRSHRKYPEWRMIHEQLRKLTLKTKELSAQNEISIALIKSVTYDQVRREGDIITISPLNPSLAGKQLEYLL
jgi:uncharacterized phage-associated protein